MRLPLVGDQPDGAGDILYAARQKRAR